jgi:hypothetical protein
MADILPGENIRRVLSLFSRGEAFDSAGFTTFFTDTPVYQFGNFELALDKAAIQASADNFFRNINAVYHEIKTMWEHGGCVFVEMDVHYWRKDNSHVSLPCFDLFRLSPSTELFSELRIFMDVNPVFEPTRPVSPQSSVLVAERGKPLLAPGTMKRFFAESPEGRRRVREGFIPKWSLSGPRWPIG